MNAYRKGFAMALAGGPKPHFPRPGVTVDEIDERRGYTDGLEYAGTPHTPCNNDPDVCSGKVDGREG